MILKIDSYFCDFGIYFNPYAVFKEWKNNINFFFIKNEQ